MAGSQSSTIVSIGISPAQPVVRRGRGALEVGALPGLAGATLAQRLLPGLDALLDALALLVALLVRVVVRVRVGFGRRESGLGDRAGVRLRVA